MSNSLESGDRNLNTRTPTVSYQAKLGYGDFYTTGKTWNRFFINSLVDARIAFIPVIHAAAVEGPPKKPPPMKYTDLPITECNEFYEYKRYLEDRQKCPGGDVKILQTFLCPIVHKYRKALSNSIFGVTGELGLMKKEACDATCKHLRCVKKFMRHPDNLLIRRVIVILSTLTGIYIGSGSRSIPKKLFFGTLGALAAGALCFPKETDVIFRNTTYSIVKVLISLYNSTCGKDYALRERIPCRGDLPPPPPPMDSHQKNKKCEEEKIKKEAAAKAAAAAKAEAEAKARAAAKAAKAAAAGEAAKAAAAAAARAKERCRDE